MSKTMTPTVWLRLLRRERANRLGLCDEGPVMVVYPEGVWYRRVQSSDVSEIVDAHLLNDKPSNIRKTDLSKSLLRLFLNRIMQKLIGMK